MQPRRILALLFAAAFLAPSLYSEPVSAAQSKRKTTAKASAYRTPVKPKRHAVTIRRPATVVRTATQPEFDAGGNPLLRSASVLVQDQSSGQILYEKNSDAVVPIASITKLMTAMVVLDAQLSLSEILAIGEDDVDTLRRTRSRLVVGASLTREDMLRLALMSSENRAAATLARHYPGGTDAFVREMNFKAASLGLTDTRFYDSTGLNAGNVSSARDLVKMVAAASTYPLIREFSTTAEYSVAVNGRTQNYHNTNSLVGSPEWQIGVSKTGFINESGKCLVMQAWFSDKPMVIVLLDSWGRLTRIGDANRIKRWVESVALNLR